MPGVQLEVSSDEAPEEEILYLPSCLSQEQREARKLESLAEVEGQIRTGQLHDCIVHVRDAAKAKSLALRTKLKIVEEQKPIRYQCFKSKKLRSNLPAALRTTNAFALPSSAWVHLPRRNYHP